MSPDHRSPEPAHSHDAEIRPQYHFRPTSDGLDAWDVRRLVALSRDLPVTWIDPNQIAELDQDHWYFHGSERPTPRSLIEHFRLIEACEPRYPVILDCEGRLMDGMHRVCKAILEGVDRIPAVRFEVDPAPDFVGCDPESLPYGE